MKNIFSEPLLHFLLAGSLLFIAYAWLNQGEENEPRVVRISAAEVNWLRETWSRQWARPPDKQELRGLLEGHLKEKLLALEARELGLELDDTVVRRRLAQKMEFLVQDTASLAEPAEAELRKLYDENRTDYQSPARLSFTQVYFRKQADALQGLDKVKLAGADELGDPSLLTRVHVLVDKQAVTSVFGPDFTNAVFALAVAEWKGPVASSYGFHLVKINEHQLALQRPFEEVRDQVTVEWLRIREGQVKEQYYAELLKKYDVVLDEDIASLLGPLTGVVR